MAVGDLMPDKYLSGSVERLSPEAPVPMRPSKPGRFHQIDGAGTDLQLQLVLCRRRAARSIRPGKS